MLAETLGSTGAALHAGRDRFTVGIEINATHHRAAAAGQVTGVATQVHAGRTLATYDIVITDDQGRRVCTARLSCLFARHAVTGGRGAPPPDPSAWQPVTKALTRHIAQVRHGSDRQPAQFPRTDVLPIPAG